MKAGYWIRACLCRLAMVLSGTIAAGATAAQERSPLMLVGHGGQTVLAAAQGPNDRILLGYSDGFAVLWDSVTGAQLSRFAHESAVALVALSEDAQLALTLDADGVVRLWNTETGAELRRQDSGQSRITAAAVSPDGRHVLTGQEDGLLQLWEAHSGALVMQFVGHTGRILSVAFSADAAGVLSASSDGTVRLWQPATGAEIRRISSFCRYTAFSRDGNQAMCVTPNRGILLWDTNDWTETLSFPTGQVRQHLTSAAFSGDGRHVLTGSADGIVALWDVRDGRIVGRFVGHERYIAAVAVGPDGRHVLTASHDGTARLWDATTGAEVQRFVRRSDVVFTVSPDGRHILSGGSDGFARFWDADSGELIWSIDLSRAVTSVAFSPNGQRIVIGTRDREPPSQDVSASIRDAGSGRVLRGFRGQFGAMRTAVAFSPDGQQLLVGRFMLTGAENDLAVWDAETGAMIRRYEVEAGRVVDVAFGVDGRQILIGELQGMVRLLDASTGAEFRRFDMSDTDIVTSVAFSADGLQVLTTSPRAARLWDVSTGSEVMSFYRNRGSISSAALSSDSTQVVTGDPVGAQLWDATTGSPILGLSLPAPVSSVAFAPAGDAVLTGSEDGIIRIWPFNRPPID